MNKEQIIAELVRMNVVLTGDEKMDQLRKLYNDKVNGVGVKAEGQGSDQPPASGSDNPDPLPPEPAPAPVPETKKEKGDKLTATVELPNGFRRTYSLSMNGENFAELAQEFATKKGGVVL